MSFQHWKLDLVFRTMKYQDDYDFFNSLKLTTFYLHFVNIKPINFRRDLVLLFLLFSNYFSLKKRKVWNLLCVFIKQSQSKEKYICKSSELLCLIAESQIQIYSSRSNIEGHWVLSIHLYNYQSASEKCICRLYIIYII